MVDNAGIICYPISMNKTEEFKRRKIEITEAWRKNNPDKWADNRAAQKRRRIRLRDEMVEAYGGECVCCGESTTEFLTIDHIRNDGQEHRKSIGGGGTNFLSALKKLGWPKDTLRLLCMNCNWASRFSRICPHSLTKPKEMID